MKKLTTLTVLLVALTGLAVASTAEMTIFPQESSTKIDSFTSYQVNIENIGAAKDTYSLSSNSPREVSIAPQQVTLEPGQEETVNVWYNPDVNKEEGTYTFNVEADSRASGQTYSAQGVVNVIADHKVSFTTADSRTACLGENARYELEITNEGLQTETFSIETDLGQATQNEVTLQDEETKTVDVVVSSNEVTQQDFNIRVSSTTNSYAQQISTVTFTAESCFGSQTSLTPQNQDVAAQTTGEYTVTVRNTGTLDNEFVLESNIGTFEDSTLEIDGLSSSSTTLEVTPTQLGEQQVNVRALSDVNSSATATMNVVNGMSSNVQIRSSDTQIAICEDETAEIDFRVENTGATEETFRLESQYGDISEDEATLETGEAMTGEVTVDATQLSPGTYQVGVRSTASSYDGPSSTRTAQLTIENCYDLELEVLPEVASAGENRSTIYEIRLNNSGTRENTYQLSYEGPEWIEIQPENITVASGQVKTAYMYAGIPFEKKGEVKITATAQGENVVKSEEVMLVINKEIEDSILSSDDQVSPTGSFANSINSFVENLDSNFASKVLASLLVALIVAAAILYREL